MRHQAPDFEFASVILDCGWHSGQQILSAEVTDQPQIGQLLSFNANGSFTYKANEDAYGRDLFRIIVHGLGGYSPKAAVYITVDQRRTILLTGYWPPTDTGNGTRGGILSEFSQPQLNYHNSGYDVIAVSPSFPVEAPGTQNWNGVDVPYWGKGTGTLIVDYRATARDFWNLVEEHRPIAIMSFSRGNPDKSWEFEEFATNWANIDWAVTLGPYNRPDRTEAPAERWDRPYIGGSFDDPAPPSKGHDPLVNSPPDPTLAADATRPSNLPIPEMITAIDGLFGNPNRLDVYSDGIEGAGNFVSNYMAYLVAWYREWRTEVNAASDKAVRYSGHTHVGVFVDPVDGQAAVRKQLEVLIAKLDEADG